MFVHRNSIIVALCLTFPSVADAFCTEVVLAECIPAIYPKKAKCRVDHGNGSAEEFFICCSEDQKPPPDFLTVDHDLAVCTSIYGTDEELATNLAEVIANANSATNVPEVPATCYEFGKPGDRCLDPNNPVRASCDKDALYDKRTFGACCQKNAEALTISQPDTVCTLWGSSAPTVGAWTLTAVGAVATTAAAFYGI